MRFGRLSCWLLVSLAVLAGCGKDEAKKPATQVAARVNSEEITIHQINHMLSKGPNVTPEALERAKTDILNRLIDQQLARQQALDKKLDRRPAVVQALEAAKSEILARAYLEQVAAAQPQPTPEEVRNYYAEHPELFARRRIYSIEEVTFVSQEDLAGELERVAAKAATMQVVADWLKARGIKYAASRAVRAAEQIPLELLPKFKDAKDGQIVVVVTPNKYNVVRIAASKADPVDEAAAAPRIQQFLANRRASEAVQNELKQLKAGAKIEYFGEFGTDAVAAAAKARARAEAQAKAQAKAQAEAQAEAEARAAEMTKARLAAETKARLDAEAKSRAEQAKIAVPQKSIEKGVGGLR